jgi:hypothetical protein
MTHFFSRAALGAALIVGAALCLAPTATAQQGPTPAVSFGAGLGSSPEGFRIDIVVPGATASAIGMHAGDIILEVGGRAVTAPQVIGEYIRGLTVGDPVSILVRRDGRTIELKGRAMPRPAGLAPPRAVPVQADELFETWNERQAAGSPMEGLEVDGWTLAASMPLARSEHAIAELNGQVWVLGGYPPGRIPSNLVQVYDPTTNWWSLGPSLPQPIHHIMVAAVDGKLYVIGGEINGAGSGRPPTYVAQTWVHDPAVGGWVQRAPMPTPRSGGGAAVVDGKIYVAGGRPPGGHAFEVYDPATDTWERLPDLPTQRNHLAMAAVNGRIIVAGGRVDDVESERVTAVEIYDPKTRRWTEGAPLPAPRGGVTGAAHAGCMFVFAGEGEPTHVLGLTPTTYGYDPRTDRWTRLPDLPIAMHGLKGSAVIRGRIYLPGGAITLGGNTGTNAVQVYRPAMSCE